MKELIKSGKEKKIKLRKDDAKTDKAAEALKEAEEKKKKVRTKALGVVWEFGGLEGKELGGSGVGKPRRRPRWSWRHHGFQASCRSV